MSGHGQTYQRFAITVPSGMAAQIEDMCKLEGRNRSEFFREAVRLYISSKFSGKVPHFVMPAVDDDEQQNNPFRLFTEWGSEADTMYDVLR